MTSADDKSRAKTHPWVVILAHEYFTRARDRQAAQRTVEHPYRYGHVKIRNERTGETWERRGGAWFKMIPSKRERRQAERDKGHAA